MPKMLILEDDAATADVLVEYISSFDIETFVARTVAEAFRIARREKPDAVYFDAYLEGENSLRHLDEFRAILPSAYFMLTSARQGVEKQAKELPVNTFIPKPFNLEEITKVVERIA